MLMNQAGGKRQDIIAAAIRLLARGGATGLTASALAAEAGVSKANVFHHFATIDDVAIAAFEAFVLGMASLRPDPASGLRAWLVALGTETTELMDAHRAEGSAYIGFIARAQSDERLRARLEDVVTAFEAALREALVSMAPGRYETGQADALATLLLLAGDGLALHRQLFPGRADRQHAAWMALVDLIAPEEISP
jgi:AcrR family transcriptional regulator